VVVCASFGVLLVPQASDAAGCTRPAPRVAAQRAAVVFTGVVTSAAGAGTSFVQTVRVDRIYKGQVTTAAEQRVRTTGGRCGLGKLKAGARYVVMATPSGDSWLAGPRSGTAAASGALVARVQSLLGQGTAPTTRATPPKVSYEQVGATRPRTFLRSAAPGFALVIVGLLGLAVARRWGRATA
jgi:hypothetical protein